MNDHPVRHELGRIDVVTLVDTPALSRDIALDVDAVKSTASCRSARIGDAARLVPVSVHRMVCGTL
jgi:hypothetical protein